MKKLALLLIFVFICLSLAACEPAWISLGYATGIEAAEAVSVELINYKNDDQEKAPIFLTNIFIKPAAFKNENYSVLETLGEDRVQEFIERLKVSRIMADKKYESPKGYCLKIVYTNGNFLIVGLDDEKEGYIGEYAADGSVVECYGSVRLCYNDPAMLANQFFEYQVPVTEEQVKNVENDPMERGKQENDEQMD